MKFEETQLLLQKALHQRNFGYVIATGLLITNLFLTYKVLNSEERWLLIPQFDTTHTIGISTSRYSETYLIDWADGIVRHLLTVNPDSVSRHVEDVLKISSTGYGDLKENLKREAKRLKTEHISTVFYPKDFDVYHDKRQIHVKGQHLTYFGRDKNPVSHEKIFVLQWKIGGKGFLFLEGFKELSHE